MYFFLLLFSGGNDKINPSYRFCAAKGRIMKFRELKKSLAEGVKPIYLITGEDSFFIERSIALICNACLAQPDLNLTRFDGKEIKRKNLYPLF